MLSFIGWPYQISASESGIGPFLPFIYAIAHSPLHLPHPILSEMDAPPPFQRRLVCMRGNMIKRFSGSFAQNGYGKKIDGPSLTD